MKKTLLYLLFFSYTVIVLKPVFPTIADTMAHIFWYSEHMATVHYENGKYHVHYEYEQAAKNNHSEKDNSVLKSYQDNDHIVNRFFYIFSNPVLVIDIFRHFSASFSSADKDSIYAPPRA